MKQNKTFTIYMITVVIMGSYCFAAALYNVSTNSYGWSYFLLVFLTILLSPRLSLTLPYSKLGISFGDTIIFLTFLFFGGKAAVVLATVEMLANCIHLRLQKAPIDNRTILFNTSASAVTTTISIATLALFQENFNFQNRTGKTADLIGTLSILAVTQFTITSLLTVFFHSLKDKATISQTWSRIWFNLPIVYLSAAILAGIIYLLINNVAFINIGIIFGIFVSFYYGFRYLVNNLNDSIEKAEAAERKRADAEKKRAEEAEKNLAKFHTLFQEQEKISQALQQSKEALERSAYFDALTGLFNRKYLNERLELLLDLGINTSNRYYVLFLDLRSFKHINDSLGHPVGDKVLLIVAQRLKRVLRDEDTIARIGGDEFAIVLNDLADSSDAEKFARRIYKRLSQPYTVEGNKIFSDLHIGISPFASEHIRPEDILRDADIAMHYAKEQKKPIAFFTKELREKFLETVKLESDLRFALKRNEFLLYYQPIVSIKESTLIGFETLLRWQHPKYGFISPAQFIPIAEESGLIIPMTRWILQKACLQIAAWQNISPECRQLKVGVNISGKHLGVDDLPDSVESALKESQIHPSSLTLEFTESSAMKNVERSIEILHKLRSIGVSLSIDDFGTGYSSLSYLHRLPFDMLKIDRSFVMELEARRENFQILQTIVSLARNLKLQTVAEGIETENQLRIMTDLDCDFGQGYLFSKPLPKEAVENMLYQKNHWIPLPEAIADEKNITHDISGANPHLF